MPLDQYDDEDESKQAGRGARAKSFDCPSCSANNPYDDGFGPGDEVRCYYCGIEYRVEQRDDGKLKFREL